jgi:hypothetical protein
MYDVKIININMKTTSMILTHPWLKLVHTPFFTIHVVIFIQTSIIDMLQPEG